MVTVWLDPDVAQSLDELIQDKPQAERQRMINQALRDYLN
jgi:metal-responsive CopG/Arc/MetJ family transcriptional regulator